MQSIFYRSSNFFTLAYTLMTSANNMTLGKKKLSHNAEFVGKIKINFYS